MPQGPLWTTIRTATVGRGGLWMGWIKVAAQQQLLAHLACRSESCFHGAVVHVLVQIVDTSRLGRSDDLGPVGCSWHYGVRNIAGPRGVPCTHSITVFTLGGDGLDPVEVSITRCSTGTHDIRQITNFIDNVWNRQISHPHM